MASFHRGSLDNVIVWFLVFAVVGVGKKQLRRRALNLVVVFILDAFGGSVGCTATQMDPVIVLTLWFPTHTNRDLQICAVWCSDAIETSEISTQCPQLYRERSGR